MNSLSVLINFGSSANEAIAAAIRHANNPRKGMEIRMSAPVNTEVGRLKRNFR